VSLLDYQRDSFARKVSGVTDDEAAASPVPSGTSLLWLANHMADAEMNWVLRRFLRQPEDWSEEDHAATLVGAVTRYRRLCSQVDEVLARETNLDAACPDFDGGPSVNLRWILAHLLEETARHAGHADILRELIDGSVGR
jgi:uncharacterized damage-inducible protein DinB